MSRSSIAVIVVTLLAIVFTSLVGGVLLERHQLARPAMFDNGEPPESAPVSSRVYTDPQKVTVAFIRSAQAPLASPVSGRVTATNCMAEGTISTGSSVFEVDDRQVVALHTRIPLWRSLEKGMKGDDVMALQETLIVSGASGITADGIYGTGTDQALRQLLRTAGMVLVDREPTPFDHILWIPSDVVAVEPCALLVGQTVAQGQDVVTLSKTLVRIEVRNPPATVMPGPREVKVGTLVIAIGADGCVTDPVQLGEVEASPEYRYGIDVSQDDAIISEVEWSLQTGISVSSVPPRALFGVEGDRGCVLVQGQVVPVTLVASSLGNSLVQFDDGTEPPAEVGLTIGGRTCE